MAVGEGKLNILKYLVGNVPYLLEDKLLQNNSGVTPLHTAAAIGDLESLKVLAEAAPQALKMKDNNGDTVLHYAADRGDQEMLKFLVIKDPDLFSGDLAINKSQMTPLHKAAIKGQKWAVEFLMGTNPEFILAKTKNGKTASDLAQQFGKTEIKAIIDKESEGGSSLQNTTAIIG